MAYITGRVRHHDGRVFIEVDGNEIEILEVIATEIELKDNPYELSDDVVKITVEKVNTRINE